MTTPEAAALTEQERARLIAAMGHGDWCDGCGGPQWINERGEHECMVLELVVESILAARLADSRPVVSEAAIEAAVKAMVQESNQFKPASYDRMARAALTAALPHMGDGKGEAEWNGDKRASGWLGKHDPAEMNTLARIVTDNAGERHPLFSVRYGIAVALLESDWLADKQAAVWRQCCEAHARRAPGKDPADYNPYLRLSPTGDDTP